MLLIVKLISKWLLPALQKKKTNKYWISICWLCNRLIFNITNPHFNCKSIFRYSFFICMDLLWKHLSFWFYNFLSLSADSLSGASNDLRPANLLCYRWEKSLCLSTKHAIEQYTALAMSLWREKKLSTVSSLVGQPKDRESYRGWTDEWKQLRW